MLEDDVTAVCCAALRPSRMGSMEKWYHVRFEERSIHEVLEDVGPANAHSRDWRSLETGKPDTRSENRSIQ